MKGIEGAKNILKFTETSLREQFPDVVEIHRLRPLRPGLGMLGL